MHAETVLTPADLIWPLFVTEGSEEEPIASLPGVSRWSVKAVAERAKEAAALGIPCVALFPNTPANLRSDDGREALNPDNLMCRAIRAIKDAVPDLGVLTDVALDPYTSHGHDGIVDAAGYVLNDATSAVLTDPFAQGLQGFAGVLDAKGKAEAQLDLHKLPLASLVGVSINHAFLAGPGFPPTLASNAVLLQIVP